MWRLFLIIFCFYFLRPVSAASFDSIEDLKDYASSYCAHMLVTEANRAHAELKMLYNFDAFGERGATEIMQELQTAGFFHNDSHCDLQNPDIVFNEGVFAEKSVSEYSALTGPFIPVHLIIEGLKLEDRELKVFLLNHLHEFQYEVNLTPLIAESLASEKNDDLYQIYAGVLQQPHYFSNRAAELSVKLAPFLEKAFNNSDSLEQRACLLFLAFSFSTFRPEQVDVPMMIYLLDEYYPFDFILSVFKHYPLDLIEEFTVPFKEGYGDKFEVLMELFARFPESRKCMQSLAYALLNRNRRHFAGFQGEIIRTWERLTGLEWQGVDTPFIEWYKENRPPHREAGETEE